MCRFLVQMSIFIIESAVCNYSYKPSDVESFSKGIKKLLNLSNKE